MILLVLLFPFEFTDFMSAWFLGFKCLAVASAGDPQLLIGLFTAPVTCLTDDVMK